MLYTKDLKTNLFKDKNSKKYTPASLYLGSKKTGGYSILEPSQKEIEIFNGYNDSAFIKINGESNQAGTPSPSTPVNINSPSNFDLITTDESGQTKTINFPYTLNGLSDGTKDYIEIDNINKIAKLYKFVGEFEFLDSGTYSPYTYNGLLGVYSSLLPERYTRVDGVCSHEKRVGAYYMSTGTYIWIGVNSQQVLWVGILDELNITSLAEFKTWLGQQTANGNTVKGIYKLKTPVVTDLDYDEVTTYCPYTKIYTNATVQPTLDCKIRVQDIRKGYDYNLFTGTDIVVNDTMRGVAEKLSFTCKSEQESGIGKNKLKTSAFTNTTNGVTFSMDTLNELTVDGTSTGSTSAIQFISNIGLPSATYTITMYRPSGVTGISIYFYNSAGTRVADFYQTTTSSTYTITNDISYASLQVFGVRTYSNYKYRFQIELGSTATAFEAYYSYPSPNVPSTISSSGDGGYVNVWSHKKNMINPNLPVTSQTVNGITVTNNNDGIWTISGTSTGTVAISLTTANTIPLTSGVAYTNKLEIISGSFAGNITVAVININGTTTYNYMNVQIGTLTRTVTPAENKKIRLYEYYCGSGTTVNAVIRVQLEQSSSATPYEPYTGSVVPITLPTGYVGGSLPNGVADTNTQQKIGKVVLNGSETWTVAQSTGNANYYYCYTFALDGLVKNKSNQTIINEFCDKFTVVSNLTTGVVISSDSLAVQYAGTLKLRIMILKTRVDAMSGVNLSEKFKNWLDSNNTTVYYELATPIDVSITKPQILLSDGTNYITTTNSVKPSLEVGAWEKMT